jgi:catechol 2,3-dioxygenase-like lactoylglutathione lyase family enzyme
MAIQIKRVGHVGILVSDIERSLRFYTDVLQCRVTNRRKAEDGTETVFLRFEDNHHDLVIVSAPMGSDTTSAAQPERLIQQIAFEVEDRDQFLRALAHLNSKGVEITSGPLVHGFEGGGTLGGSGSRSFYFSDPDGNRLEVYTDMMRVSEDGEFPPKEYAEVMKAFMKK